MQGSIRIVYKSGEITILGYNFGRIWFYSFWQYRLYYTNSCIAWEFTNFKTDVQLISKKQCGQIKGYWGQRVCQIGFLSSLFITPRSNIYSTFHWRKSKYETINGNLAHDIHCTDCNITVYTENSFAVLLISSDLESNSME